MKSHALSPFWQCYEALPEPVQRLAKKNFALLKVIHDTLHSVSRKKAAFTRWKLAGVTARSHANGMASITGSGLERMKNTIASGFSVLIHTATAAKQQAESDAFAASIALGSMLKA